MGKESPYDAKVNKAIIFDFDGTIADSLQASFQVFNDLAPDFGLRQISSDDLPALKQLTVSQLIQQLSVKPRHVPAILKRARDLLRERMIELKPCPGMAEQLPVLRKQSKHFGILTSNSVENVEIFLRHQGLRQHFDFISTCSKLKGKAKYLRGIARTFSLDPTEMIYVGDEIRDIKAGHKAKVPVAAVTWGFNSMEALSQATPRWLFDDPEKMPPSLINQDV